MAGKSKASGTRGRKGTERPDEFYDYGYDFDFDGQVPKRAKGLLVLKVGIRRAAGAPYEILMAVTRPA